MTNKRSPTAPSSKDEKGRVLLHCEHKGSVRKMTFTRWGEVLDRDPAIIKRAYYAGHKAEICLGLEPWPEPRNSACQEPKDTRVAQTLFNKLARRGLCPNPSVSMETG